MSAHVGSSPTPTITDATIAESVVTDSPWNRISRLSVSQYHAMIGAGILSSRDRVELLEGLLVTKMPKHPPHVLAAKLLHAAMARLLPAGWHVSKEDPIVLPPESEPEPDLCVLRGDPRDYATRNPEPAEIALVVEVADSTLAFDRGFKLRLYARAGLPLYWIVNLTEGVVEIHGDPAPDAPEPSYRRREVIGRDGVLTLELPGAEPIQIAARDFLP